MSRTTNPLTFPSFLPLTPTTSHTYTLQLLDSFCVGTVPNGGYITCAFLHVARTHMQSTHPSLCGVNPINLHLQFLRRTSVGLATFTVRDVKLGSRVSNLHIVLSQAGVDEVEGYVVMSDLKREVGVGWDTGYKKQGVVRRVDLKRLAREGADEEWVRRRMDPYAGFRRAALHCEMHLVRPEMRRGDGPAVLEMWNRFRPLGPSTKEKVEEDVKKGEERHVDGRWTNEALGYVVDVFPQLNERYLNGEVEDALLLGEDEVSEEGIRELVRLGKKGDRENRVKPNWYPTLLLNLDVKKLLPEEGVEWLFVRVQTKRVHNGRFDLDIEVWDEEGDLVALSTHAALVVDASRNLAREPKSKM